MNNCLALVRGCGCQRRIVILAVARLLMFRMVIIQMLLLNVPTRVHECSPHVPAKPVRWLGPNLAVVGAHAPPTKVQNISRQPADRQPADRQPADTQLCTSLDCPDGRDKLDVWHSSTSCTVFGCRCFATTAQPESRKFSNPNLQKAPRQGAKAQSLSTTRGSRLARLEEEPRDARFHRHVRIASLRLGALAWYFNRA